MYLLLSQPIPTISLQIIESLFEQTIDVGQIQVRTLAIRAPQATTTSSATSTTTSGPPFFTDADNGGRSTPSSVSDSGNVTKTALEWVFAIAALLAVASITTWRYAQLRRRNQSLRSFIPHHHHQRSDTLNRGENTRERRSFPRTTGLPLPRPWNDFNPSESGALFYPPSLARGRYPGPLEPEPAYLARSASLPLMERGRATGRRGRRGVQGSDVDALGRRGGGHPDSNDVDGDDKEELPAYESVAVGGPPRYYDAGLQFLGEMPLRVLPSLNSTSESLTGTQSRRTRRETPSDDSTSISPGRRPFSEPIPLTNSPATSQTALR